jgi:hypothetical protein
MAFVATRASGPALIGLFATKFEEDSASNGWEKDCADDPRPW